VGNKGKEIRQGCSQNPSEQTQHDIGAITMPDQLRKVDELVSDAKAKGARIIMGGKQSDKKEFKGCLYFEPTILADVTLDMRIVSEETFGPVMPIIKFSTEEELIKIANQGIYGLGCSIFTTDYRKAERVKSAVLSGMTTINDFVMVPMVQSLPFGGCKKSGFGHFNGYEGLQGFSRVMSVVTDRFPLRVAAPSWLSYPVHPNSHLIAEEGVRMVYGKTWTGSARALLNMIKLIASKGKK